MTFDITVLRAADQGFFDIAVDLDDVFCSAKLDCDGTHTFPGFTADTTVVLAFVCTASVGVDTTLYLDDLDITCAAPAGTATIDPSAGPGLVAAGAGVAGVAGVVDAAAVYRGQEQLPGGARYWNAAFALAPGAAGCTLTTRGTASETPLTGLATAADAVYPYVDWTVPLTDGAGAVTCGAHPLGGTGAAAGVSIAYTTTGPETFAHEYPDAGGSSAAGHLVAYWPADGDSLDAVGSSDATAVGPVGFTASPWCTAWDFPDTGAVSYLTLGDAAELGLTSQITISAWVRFIKPGPATGSTLYLSLLSNWDDYTLGTAGYSLALSPTDATHFHPSLLLTSDGTITHGADASTDLVIGRWTHIVGVYDGAAITLYVDGLQVASTPYAGSIYDPPGVGIEINAIQRSGEVLHSMVGQIDEMKVYDVGLDAASVAALHEAEAPGRPCP